MPYCHIAISTIKQKEMGQKKKDFTAVAAAAFDNSGDVVNRIIAPKQQAVPAESSAREMTPAETADMFLRKQHYLYSSKDGKEVRLTFRLSTDNMKKLRAVCYAEDIKQKHVIDEALQMFFNDYEKKHGKLL